MRFSERMGLTTPKNIQLTTMDEDLRNSLWNGILRLKELARYEHKLMPEFEAAVATYIAKKPVDEIYQHRWVWLREYFMSADWFIVYDIVQLSVDLSGAFGIHRSQVTKMFNGILQREMSGYRFIDDKLAPISSDVEIGAVEDAIAEARRRGLGSVSVHHRNALSLLSKRPEPDYRNSIKESISAVEAAAKLITGMPNDSLAGPLKRLGGETGMHRAMVSGFLSLYGYTSGADGIRHALLDEDRQPGFNEAKYMLVSCSAFTHFLVCTADEAGLLKNPNGR